MGEDQLTKDRQARRVTITGSVLNALLAVSKFTAGYYFNSRALMADAVDSTTDLLTDVITLVAFPLSRKPRDSSHPYGHGRVESLASMFVSGLLIFAASMIAYKAISALVAGEVRVPLWPAALVALAALSIKEFLYRWTKKVGRKLNSRVLIANAWNHRGDAFSSIAVLIGIVGSILIPGLKFLDSVASLVVVIFIYRAGITIFVSSMNDLLDKSQDPELIKAVIKMAQEEQAVSHAHRGRARRYGHLTCIDLDIELPPEMSVQEGHDIAHRVQARILETYDFVGDVLIHIEPEGDHEKGEGEIRI